MTKSLDSLSRDSRNTVLTMSTDDFPFWISFFRNPVTQLPIPHPSRTAHLAKVYAEARNRTVQVAAAVAVGAGRGSAPVAPPARLGDDYRRPAPAQRRLKVSR